MIEPGSLVTGVPGKRVRAVGEDLSKNEIERIAGNYLKYASWYRS